MYSARALPLENPAWLRDPRVQFLDTRAPIYSVGEQLLGVGSFLQPRHAGDVLWVPHFNAPLVYRGRTVASTMHDVAPLAMPEILGSPLKRAYARLLIERAVARAFLQSFACRSSHATSLPAVLPCRMPG